MRSFLIKIIVFPIFPILFFGINFTINWSIYSNQSVSIEETNILIAGDSHTEASINPNYFISAQNISQSAEPYILTYWKLKKVFETFTPRTLILGFSPHNISQFNDLKFSSNEWAAEMFKRCYPIEQFDDISTLISIDYPTFYKILWAQTAFYPKGNHINYIGDYSNSSKNNVSDWEPAIRRHYFHKNEPLGVSAISVNYLTSIIELCTSKNIDVVLVSNPVHENYLNNIPTNIMKEYLSLVEEFSKSHVVFDKTRDNYPDSLYRNSDHLNEYGSEKFTNELIEYLQKNNSRQADR